MLTSFIGKRVNRFLSCALVLLCALPYAVQAVYHHIFKTFLFLYSVFGTNQVFQFYKQIFAAIVKCLPVILPLFLPFVIMLTFGRKYFRFNPLIWRFLPMSAAFFAVTHLVAILVMSVLPRGPLFAVRFVFQHRGAGTVGPKAGAFYHNAAGFKADDFGEV